MVSSLYTFSILEKRFFVFFKFIISFSRKMFLIWFGGCECLYNYAPVSLKFPHERNYPLKVINNLDYESLKWWCCTSEIYKWYSLSENIKLCTPNHIYICYIHTVNGVFYDRKNYQINKTITYRHHITDSSSSICTHLNVNILSFIIKIHIHKMLHPHLYIKAPHQKFIAKKKSNSFYFHRIL